MARGVRFGLTGPSLLVRKNGFVKTNGGTALASGTLRWKSRYTILSILFVTSVISFLDRIAMSVAIPYISTDFHLSSVQAGLVLSIFFAGYSISQIPGGALGDLFGVRKVVTAAMIFWSVFTALTGAVTTLTQMIVVRFLFGIGEGAFPACTFKAVAVWFPKHERATANAIRLAASPLGAALAPLVVVAIMSAWGWRSVFYILLAPGLIAGALFWLFVRDKPSDSRFVTIEEIAEIEFGEAPAAAIDARVTLSTVCRAPYMLRYFSILFLFDIAYWGFTTWLPTYLVKVRGLTMMQMGIAASLPFFAGAVGSILGGYVAQRLAGRDRRLPLLATAAISGLLLYAMYTATSLTALILYQTLAGLFMNFFVAAFWALPMTTVSKNLMGTASGFINMGGQLAAFVSPVCIGYLVGKANGSFQMGFVFLIASIVASMALVLTIPARPANDEIAI
jgi:MFS family permease